MYSVRMSSRIYLYRHVSYAFLGEQKYHQPLLLYLTWFLRTLFSVLTIHSHISSVSVYEYNLKEI